VVNTCLLLLLAQFAEVKTGMVVVAHRAVLLAAAEDFGKKARVFLRRLHIVAMSTLIGGVSFTERSHLNACTWWQVLQGLFEELLIFFVPGVVVVGLDGLYLEFTFEVHLYKFKNYN
jgi:hypothetical protein